MNPMLEAALDYANRGLRVFPVMVRWNKKEGKYEKKPITEHGLKDATTDTSQIHHWWDNAPGRGIGIATGNGLCVFDLDRKNGKDGLKQLIELEKHNGIVPKCPRSITPTGGYHLFTSVKCTVPSSADERIAPGIDVRCDGGFVVAPPTVTDTGKQYRWGVKLDALELPSAPQWLIDKAANGTAYNNGNGNGYEPKWISGALKTVEEGKRNCTAAKIIGHLLRRHVDTEIACCLFSLWNEHYCDPPLGDKELQKIAVSIATREATRRQNNEH